MRVCAAPDVPVVIDRLPPIDPREGAIGLLLLTGAALAVLSPGPGLDGPSQTPVALPAIVTIGLSKPDVADPVPPQEEVVVNGRSRRGDPLERANIESFKATEAVDRAVIGPVSNAYEHGVPSQVRKALRHLTHNLHEPTNVLNFLLQHKVGRAGRALARFAINSTVGLIGLIDVAARHPVNLPYYRNGFANTLGFYGVGPGPYLFLPIVGPSTVRDLSGHVIDHFSSPLRLLRLFHRKPSLLPVTALNALDRRADFDAELERQRATVDPYAARRQHYLDDRRAEIDILRGRLRMLSQPPVVTPNSAR